MQEKNAAVTETKRKQIPSNQIWKKNAALERQKNKKIVGYILERGVKRCFPLCNFYIFDF